MNRLHQALTVSAIKYRHKMSLYAIADAPTQKPVAEMNEDCPNSLTKASSYKFNPSAAASDANFPSVNSRSMFP
jgi:hypothetical protein